MNDEKNVIHMWFVLNTEYRRVVDSSNTVALNFMNEWCYEVKTLGAIFFFNLKSQWDVTEIYEFWPHLVHLNLSYHDRNIKLLIESIYFHVLISLGHCTV